MKRYGVMFPGQGSQFIGMGKKLYDRYDVVKKLYNDADEILGYGIKDLCFEGDIDELTKTQNTQPAILLFGVASYKSILEEIEIKPSFMAGHSIGEITALTCSEAIKFEDALKIVNKRGRLMGSIDNGAMAAIVGKISYDELDEICNKLSKGDDYVTVANYNSYNQVVVSGRQKTVEKLSDIYTGRGLRVIFLKVSGGFHSKLMSPITNEFRETLNQYKFNDLKVPVISNVDAKPYKDSKDIIDTLVKQLTSSVQWVKTLEYLKGKNLDCLIDLGPKKVVYNLAKQCDMNLELFAKDSSNEYIDFFKESKKSNNITAIEFKHNPITLSIKTVVCTKNENKDTKQYEEIVIPGYKELNKINKKIKSENRQPSREECYKAVELLKKILDCKKVSIDEQKFRLEEIKKITDESYKLNDLFNIL